jgi:hypothetical protein
MHKKGKLTTSTRITEPRLPRLLTSRVMDCTHLHSNSASNAFISRLRLALQPLNLFPQALHLLCSGKHPSVDSASFSAYCTTV